MSYFKTVFSLKKLLEIQKDAYMYASVSLRTRMIGCAVGKTRIEIWHKKLNRKIDESTCIDKDIVETIISKFRNRTLTLSDIRII